MMIEEAPVWRRYIVDPYGSPGPWEERKIALQTVLDEHPESQWADDAALCLAGGQASFEGDVDGAIAALRRIREQYPQGRTMVSHWFSDGGVRLDGVWLVATAGLVMLNPDGSVRISRPFDRHGEIGPINREWLANFEHLAEHPVYTRDVAQLMIGQMRLAQERPAEAIAELESLISDQEKLIATAAADREAIARANGFFLLDDQMQANFFPRPHMGAYDYLMFLYRDLGDPVKSVHMALEAASIISPEGGIWGWNHKVADLCAALGYWQEAVDQYRLTRQGVREYVAGRIALKEWSYVEGLSVRPPDFVSAEHSVLVVEGKQGWINRIEEALERAEAQLPITTSIALAGEPVERGEPAFLVGPAFPNPFNASTVIRFSLPHSMEIRMTVVNLMGQEIRTLVEGYQEGGGQQVVWDGTDQQGRPVASGLYLCRLRAEELTASRKLLLLR